MIRMASISAAHHICLLPQDAGVRCLLIGGVANLCSSSDIRGRISRCCAIVHALQRLRHLTEAQRACCALLIAQHPVYPQLKKAKVPNEIHCTCTSALRHAAYKSPIAYITLQVHVCTQAYPLASAAGPAFQLAQLRIAQLAKLHSEIIMHYIKVNGS